MIDIILQLLILASTIMSALAAYFFFLSTDGELRKILIRKFVTQAVFWATLLFIFPVDVELWKKWVLLFVLLIYNFVKFRLQMYLVGEIKKK